jgi:hypothetical protein
LILCLVALLAVIFAAHRQFDRGTEISHVFLRHGMPCYAAAAKRGERAWRMSQSDKAVAHIRELALAGELLSGAGFSPERQLTTELGVSRNRLREAVGRRP